MFKRIVIFLSSVNSTTTALEQMASSCLRGSATVPLLQNLIKLFTPRTWNTSQTWPLIRAQKLIINDIKLAQFTKLKSWGLIFHVLCQYVSSINWIKYFGSNSDTCFLQWLLSRALSDQFYGKKTLRLHFFLSLARNLNESALMLNNFWIHLI